MTARTRQALALLSAVALAAVAGCSAGGDRAPARLAGSPAAQAPSGAPGSTTAPAAKGFTLVASGDVLPHESVIRRAASDADGDGYDFRPMFSGVKPVVSAADLAICHMETVYGPDGGPFTGYPAFQSPPEIAAGLKDAGYDGCSTASNHTLDGGAAGLKRTLDAFDEAGLKHAGSARTAAEAGAVTMYTAGSAKVAHLAYTYDTNGYPMPDGQPWAVNLMEEEKIVADARAARKAGADVVLVSLHWGTEWETEPDGKQLALGKALTASQTGGRPDVDLVLGTHAHVPQPYEKVNGTWIIYGMGDQVAGEMFNHTGARDMRGNYGSIGRFTFAPPAAPGQRWQVAKAEFVPQMMDLGAGRVVNLPAALAAHPGREDYEEARDEITEAVLSRGAAKDGLTAAQ
ncbi:MULTISPECIES: CapA family protein [unclassified Streptomyces]|uniref:CapA family protein n=1 Tax=unclassified Streptomyces TaxID=2593676 RepID=UPI000DC767A1|nr:MULTISPECIES: CapA family protein [unclassified Streptomyces]AWZ07768.1 CapA family protein [Streptomyces sp. ICC4]AWZ15888.1 CapA family protein [Streptomyces sp. ICC1]